MNAEKLAQLKAGVRIGGKGTTRRKKKVRRQRAGATEDVRIQNTLKKLGAQTMQAIEEVNLFKSDGTVIHFTNPKFQVAGGSNMYVVTGRPETKKLQDLLPNILKSGSEALAQAAKDADDEEVPELVENFSG